MAASKKYTTLPELLVYPSTVSTIEVDKNDGYEGAHKYRVRLCEGFVDGATKYNSKQTTLQFVQKNEDGTVIPGLQSEQLALILLDRVQKMNEKFPCEENKQQIEGLEMYLAACKARVENRINRGVMGNLEK